MTMYTDLHERKGKYIIRLEARINHIMLIATFHGAPCKFSIETVLSILSIRESGVMNVTMFSTSGLLSMLRSDWLSYY